MRAERVSAGARSSVGPVVVTSCGGDRGLGATVVAGRPDPGSVLAGGDPDRSGGMGAWARQGRRGARGQGGGTPGPGPQMAGEEASSDSTGDPQVPGVGRVQTVGNGGEAPASTQGVHHDCLRVDLACGVDDGSIGSQVRRGRGPGGKDGHQGELCHPVLSSHRVQYLGDASAKEGPGHAHVVVAGLQDDQGRMQRSEMEPAHFAAQGTTLVDAASDVAGPGHAVDDDPPPEDPPEETRPAIGRTGGPDPIGEGCADGDEERGPGRRGALGTRGTRSHARPPGPAQFARCAAALIVRRTASGATAPGCSPCRRCRAARTDGLFALVGPSDLGPREGQQAQARRGNDQPHRYRSHATSVTYASGRVTSGQGRFSADANRVATARSRHRQT